MTTLIFDSETNGFVPDLDRLHILSMKDTDTGEKVTASLRDPTAPGASDEIANALVKLADADMIVGHNVIKFDIPAIQKVYPGWEPKGVVRDTLLLSRLIWPELRTTDVIRMRRKGPASKFPKKFIGKHALEAWGHRLSEYKVGTDITDWSVWTPRMQERCEQDVEVNEELWRLILTKNYNESAVELEHEFAKIIYMQETHGWPFNELEASKLYARLCKRREELGADLQQAFPAWHKPVGMFTPKRDNKKLGYTAGVPMMKTKLTYFNPGSRDHLANRLITLHNWEPTEFTDGGKPKVDETVLSELGWPEAKLASEYLSTEKVIGMLAEGKQAWLKQAKNGKIHGTVQTVGAITRRCTHARPNISQVPTTQKPYGKECRALFVAPPGYKLVGCDAEGLELRCLAHYLHRYDGGTYAEAVVSGDKAEGTDPHSIATRALGLDPKKEYVIRGRHTVGRECAKRFVYAFLYGAGDEKLGSILGKGKRHGAAMRAKFLKNFPAMAALKKQLLAIVKKQGWLRGIDGGRVVVRSDHSALNTLLQSAGAIAMKKALVLLYLDLSTRGWVHGRDYAFVGNIHDEIQAIVKEGLVDEYKAASVQAIREAGQQLGFRCPLDGDAKVGRNWASTH